MKNNRFFSKETLYESYSSIAGLINTFLTSFYKFLIQEKTWFFLELIEIKPEKNQPLLSGPLSGEQNFNRKDILFLRITYMCALLFHNLHYEFEVEDISSKILDKMYKNTIEELKELSQEKDKDLPKVKVTFSFDNKEKTFFYQLNAKV